MWISLRHAWGSFHRKDDPVLSILSALLFCVVDVSADPYYADPTGVSDSTSAIQDAVDDASPGEVLVFPRGTYLVSSNLVVTKPLSFIGGGSGSSLKASGTSLTAILEFQAGSSRSTVFGLNFLGSKTNCSLEYQRGVYFNGAAHCTVERCLFSGPNSSTGLNFGVDVNGQSSNFTRILYCDFERMVSGTAILLEATDYNHIYGCRVDSSDYVISGPPGSAIFLSATVGQGSSNNYVGYCTIKDHPQAGIDINSTSYSGQLGPCDRNVIEGNDIFGCRSSNGGDASSGIAVIGNSNFNRILGNKVHHNGHSTAGGFGIVLAGVPGEAPAFNQVLENDVYGNKDDGIRIKVASNTRVQANNIYENGQRTAATFRNIYVTGAQSTLIRDNTLYGSQPLCQVEIDSGSNGTEFSHNRIPGQVIDDGTNSLWE